MEVYLGPILPTKELIQMFEERIPGGRYLTTLALVLVLLAAIVAAASFLWQQLGVPIYTFCAAAISTGTPTC